MKVGTSTDRADLYRDAAAYIAAGKNRIPKKDKCRYKYGGACDVIHHESYPFKADWNEREAFWNLFVAGEYMLMEDEIPDAEEAQAVRVLAVCFMAAMVEAGDA